MQYIRTIAIAILLVITISLTGCFSSNPKDIEAFLMPSKVNVTARNYIMQPPDEVEIQCSKVPEIHMQRQQIRPDGKISFEAVGELDVAGKTPAQVANALRAKILELYQNEGANAPMTVSRPEYIWAPGEATWRISTRRKPNCIGLGATYPDNKAVKQ